MQGGHTTQNLLFRPPGKGVLLKQIGSELWHVSHAVKPGTLGLSSASCSPSCLGHRAQALGRPSQPIFFKESRSRGAERSWDLNGSGR